MVVSAHTLVIPRGILGKRIYEGLFRHFFFCLFFFCVGGFIGIIGGTPDKRISEGIFFVLFSLFGRYNATKVV